jgi:transposase-like protein
MKLTDKARQDYIEKDGVRCPYCNNTSLEPLGQLTSNSSGGAYQDIHCDNCGRTWTDEYTLTGITTEDD